MNDKKLQNESFGSLFTRERKQFGAARSKLLSCLQEDIAREAAKV